MAKPSGRVYPLAIYPLIILTLAAVAAQPAVAQGNGAPANPPLGQPGQVETRPANATGQPEYAIKARVPLTIVDVVVTDAKGKPVHGLKQPGFTFL